MDSDQPPSKGRKVKFQPKAPSRRKPKAAAAHPKQEEADEVDAQQLLKHFSELEALRKKRPKPEDKTLVQPTFTYAPQQPASIRAFNVPRDGSQSKSSSLDLKHMDDGGQLALLPSPSTAQSSYDSDSETEYREPWDYAGTYYPTTLPWRKPYSGDPDMLDEAEFGEVAKGSEYDEERINAATELGFLDSNEASDNPRLLFFKLPPSLPIVRRSASAKGKEKVFTSAVPEQRSSVAPVMVGRGPSLMASGSQRNVSLKELSGGQMGKLLVYKSGAIKLKLGDTLYDVSPGSESLDCPFTQEVVAVNLKEKKCCSVGELHKSAIVTPDIDNILDRLDDL
uniref:DNA-directed RNA polymerase III subunit RPC4 n=2 Tax=Opuntia streptacantha TaxID=393608 RepID=A0A7C9E1C2_OPUST